MSAQRATESYERTRRHVASFMGGVSPDEIIFTRGTTEPSISSLYVGRNQSGPGDEIVITDMEHHANLVPWVILAQRKKAILKRIRSLSADIST